MSQGVALLCAGVLIALAIVVSGRWQISVAPGQIYRLDEWTGRVTACNVPPSSNGNAPLVTPGRDIPCEPQ